MDVAFLFDKYFKDGKNVSTDVFDAHTLNAVYKDVANKMTSHLEIEVSVLQALSYCLYEIMDNALRDLRQECLVRKELKPYNDRMRLQIADLEELDHDIKVFRVDAPKNKELQATMARGSVSNR